MLLFSLLACPLTEEAACPEGGTGTLNLSLTVPAETWVSTPELVVYDQGGTAVATVTAATESLSLPGGRYTLAARRGTVDGGGNLNGQAFGLLVDTVSRVCVEDGVEAEWAGEWALQPSSGKLWVTSGESAYGFDREALAAGGDLTAAASITVELSNDLRGLAVDPMGNLWAATSPNYGSRLVVYPPAGVSGDAEPVALAGPVFDSLAAAGGIADLGFDDKDQLWVLLRNGEAGSVGLLGFGDAAVRDFLAAGAVPDAADQEVIVEGMVAAESFSLDPVTDLTWIADFGGNQVLAVGLGGGSSPTVQTIAPSDAFTAGFEDDTGTHSLDGPTAVAVDDEGRLWVDYWTSVAVARFDGATAAGVRAPDLLVSGDVLDLPAGLAADHAGGSWYGNEPQDGTGTLVRLEREAGAELARGNSAEALAPSHLVFDPR